MPFTSPPSGLGIGSPSGLGSSDAVASDSPLLPSSPHLPTLPTVPVTGLASPPDAAMSVTPPMSPQCSQHTTRQVEHDGHVLGSPENCHIPAPPTLLFNKQ